MMRPPHDPLDADERALAARLARVPAAAPSAAIDAAILAAARAATDAVAPADAAPPPMRTTPRTPPRRWPIGVGLAAALLVAVGVAWQLRPMPDARPLPSEVPMAISARSAPGATPERRVTRAASATDAVAAPASDAPDPAVTTPVERAEDRGGTEARPAGDATPAEPVSRAAPAAAATAPPASPPLARQRTALGTDAIAAPAAAPAARAFGAPVAAPKAPALQTQEVSHDTSTQAMRFEDLVDDVPDDEQPPASADSPDVRRAWLHRVRELLDAGDIAAARASLGEFHRRHPDAELPPDLRALLD